MAWRKKKRASRRIQGAYTQDLTVTLQHLKCLYLQGPDGVVVELMETQAPLPASAQDQDEES